MTDRNRQVDLELSGKKPKSYGCFSAPSFAAVEESKQETIPGTRECATDYWSLKLGHWSFNGHWDLDIGVSFRKDRASCINDLRAFHMDHTLREKCDDLRARILHLRDSL